MIQNICKNGTSNTTLPVSAPLIVWVGFSEMAPDESKPLMSQEDLTKAAIDTQDYIRGLKIHFRNLSNEVAGIKTQIDTITASSTGLGNAAQGCSSLPVPVYNPVKMTAGAFLQEVEEHMVLKVPDKSLWLAHVSRMFSADSDIASWWRAVKFSVTSWDDFKLKFRAYERDDQSKDDMMHELFQKKQKLEDPFESYAWEIRTIYSKIDPNFKEEEAVERILHSCLPEISLVVSQSKVKTVAELVILAKQAIGDINKIRRIEGKQFLRARKTDPIYKPSQSKNPNFSYRQDRGHSQNTPSQTFGSIPVESNSTLPPSHASQSRSNKYCNHCRLYGHNDHECRKKAAKEGRQNNPSQSGN